MSATAAIILDFTKPQRVNNCLRADGIQKKLVSHRSNCLKNHKAHDLAVDLGYMLEHRHAADGGTHQRILLLCHPHTSLCVLNAKDEWHLRAMDLRESQPSVRVTKGDAEVR